jgi:hypothetical protein
MIPKPNRSPNPKSIRAQMRRIVVDHGVIIINRPSKGIFYDVGAVWIPASTQIRLDHYFYCHRSLRSILFEWKSALTQIGSEAFWSSSIRSIMIPSNVTILAPSCFSSCHSLSSVLFESNSRLIRIESQAFSRTAIRSITIPRNADILCSSSFSECPALSYVAFESNSRLRRIESDVFANSSLESIVIPHNVRFIDGSAFRGITVLSVSIEPGNSRFVLEHDFLVDVIDHKLIRNLSTLCQITIPCEIEILARVVFLDVVGFPLYHLKQIHD